MGFEQVPVGAYTRVFFDRVGRGKHARAIRRAFLFEHQSHRLLESQVAYLDLEFGLESLNAQLAVLADLNFLLLWANLRKRRDPTWVPPEQRAASNALPLTQKEITDFGRWCQRKSRSLTEEIESGKVRRFPGTDVVSVAFRNRRLRNASLYVQWLVTMLADIDETSENDATLVESRRRLVEKWIDKQLLPDARALPPRSLHPTQAKALQKAFDDQTIFPATDIGTRDRLVFELLSQGLRAGELLKLQCIDINDAYEIDLGRSIGVVSIVRRPNDIDDERVNEPAVKTRPGTLPIPKRVVRALIAYVTDVRRPSVDARRDGKETPYLFVNHHGEFVGRALSQRNLNRIVAKLKGQFGLPDTFDPHTMRHTHLTELYDQARKNGRSDLDIRDLLVDRGRWAPDSAMPKRYTGRALMRESAEYVEKRDEELRRG